MAPRKVLLVVLAFALNCGSVYGEDDQTAEFKMPPPEKVETEENDETRQLLNKLTITMISEVVDERTVMIRESAAKGGKQLLRLGNVAPIDKASMTDEEYAEKLEQGKTALKSVLKKQMVWYKAAAPEFQPSEGQEVDGTMEKVVLGDIWTTEGKHINSLILKEGHVVPAQHYEEELARDILQAESEKQKEQSYKDLEAAIRESEKEKAKIAAAEKAERLKKAKENEPVEPIGFAGWVGIVVVVAIITFSVWTKLQRKTKNNPNRKRGPLEKLWNKVKGQ